MPYYHQIGSSFLLSKSFILPTVVTRSILTLGLVLSLVISFSASAVNVLSSIKPFQLISYEITKGVGQSDVLLGTTTSPHDYALRPSDLVKIQEADLMIWFGSELEPFLAPILSKSKQKSKTLQLSKLANINLYTYSKEEHSHPDDDKHKHSGHDPHIWLDPQRVKIVATAIANELGRIDPPNLLQYQTNLKQFIKQLDIETKLIKQELIPIQKQSYYVFHDAYGYFERAFGLSPKGYFTISPLQKPGAKTLIKIRKTLVEQNVKCIFSEPQFTPSVIKSITNGTNVQLGVLDPLATEIVVRDGSYFTFLHQLAGSFRHCLA